MDDTPSANNQNAYWRSTYRHRNEDGETNECTMIHIPMVQKLIQKYASHTWGLGVNHPDFVMIESTMCLLIHNRIKRPRNKVIELLTAGLDCTSLHLHNDKELSEHLDKHGVL